MSGILLRLLPWAGIKRKRGVIILHARSLLVIFVGAEASIVRANYGFLF